MLKVNNKKVIQDLAKTTYKANKKRNLLTIVAIFLTTFLLCTVISIGLSYWDTVSLRQQRMQGIDYDIELTEPRDDQVSTIRKMDNVKYAGLNVKCGIVSKYQDKELVSNVKLFKDSLVEIIDDVFDCYDLIINLFGGQCQII